MVAQYPEETRSLVTHRFGLDEVSQAFATAADKGHKSIKVHINPGA